MPGAATIAGVFNLVAGHKLLAVAHTKTALSFDSCYYVGPVEFYLDPFFAEIARMNRISWTPSASSNVQIKSVHWSIGVCGRSVGWLAEIFIIS